MRIILLALFLTGCVQVAPNLKLPEVKQPEKQCAKLDMPPIADQVHITIEGNSIKADAGGELLIRNYVKAQKLLK